MDSNKERHLKPNAQSLLEFLCESLNDLAAKKIDVEEAKAQATLAKQINNVLNYNLDKVNLKLKLQNGQNHKKIEMQTMCDFITHCFLKN